MNIRRCAFQPLVVYLFLCCLSTSFATTLPELPAPELTPAEEAEVQSLVLPVPEDWVGDFEGMRQRRLVRVLVPYSKTFSNSIAVASVASAMSWARASKPG